MDWWQFVDFVEGGRVAGEYSLSELTRDWKFDAGGSLRFMVAGRIIRIDAAYGNEGGTFWFMAGQPF